MSFNISISRPSPKFKPSSSDLDIYRIMSRQIKKYLPIDCQALLGNENISLFQ